ncbi:MAG TPA: DUF481 domain-containing protein [Terracidiphilus sp.]|nr:DUF481 domain-containing protein [Terracidiphilus sp.]
MTLPASLSLALFRVRISYILKYAVAPIAIAAAVTSSTCFAQNKPAAAAPDVLVLSNGDTLHGKFVNAVSGKVNFHSDILGDISLDWDKVKELHTGQQVAVLKSNTKVRGKGSVKQVPMGTVDVADKTVTVHPANGANEETIPLKDAEYVVDKTTLNKELFHHPGITEGWNGAATAGATLVTATENQYTFSGGIGLVRVVPTVSWLSPRDRTSLDFTGSFGKITQPSYTIPATGTTPAIFVAAVSTKSAIYHADAERDEYFSPRFFALAQTAFDHNYGQDLDLQQIYGGGGGWTALKTPKQEADLKATMQYEKQGFISGASANQNLVGSTFSASYLLHMKLVTYTQGLAFIPAYNNFHAYSTNETNTLAFPAYKRLSFSVGTLDSYLNDPPVSLPPTKRNSFQFTMGLTYAIKSSY